VQETLPALVIEGDGGETCRVRKEARIQKERRGRGPPGWGAGLHRGLHRRPEPIRGKSLHPQKEKRRICERAIHVLDGYNGKIGMRRERVQQKSMVLGSGRQSN